MRLAWETSGGAALRNDLHPGRGHDCAGVLPELPLFVSEAWQKNMAESRGPGSMQRRHGRPRNDRKEVRPLFFPEIYTTWIMHIDDVNKVIWERVRCDKTVSCEVYMLDPGSTALELRSGAGASGDSARAPLESQQTVRWLGTEFEGRARVAIHLYDDLTPFQVYKFDRSALVGFYVLGEDADQEVHVQVQVGQGCLGELVEAQIERIRKLSNEYERSRRP